MSYKISWCQADEIEALAKKRGMPDDGAIFDYAEEHEALKEVVKPTFDEAVAFAKTKTGDDVSGEVRVEHLIKVRCRVTGDRLEADAVWYIYGDTDRLDENCPDYSPESDLTEDEEIIG